MSSSLQNFFRKNSLITKFSFIQHLILQQNTASDAFDDLNNFEEVYTKLVSSNLLKKRKWSTGFKTSIQSF